jgi:multiple sugar transport system substrate-binding protein
MLFNNHPHLYAASAVDMSDVAEEVGKKGGGYYPISTGNCRNKDKWLAMPFCIVGAMNAYRKSWFAEAGFNKFPETWDQYREAGKKLKAKGRPLGQSMGHSFGDPPTFAYPLLWSFGGAEVDKAGKVAINSKETISALTYLKELYPTFVTGTLSWGDVSNNRAFAANEVWLTANGVSLYFALKNDPATKPIADDTDHAPLMSGIIGKQPQSALVLNGMVFKHSKYPNAAKAFLQYMMEVEQYDKWLTGCLGYWAHPLKAYSGSKVWDSDPKLAVYREGMNNQFWTGYKGPINQSAGAVAAEYILVQMCASVASGQATPQDAVKEAERRSRRYYR